MVSEEKIISRISCVGIKVVDHFAPLLELLCSIVDFEFTSYDSASDPKIFLIEVWNVVN
jgi:hypothetical protein